MDRAVNVVPWGQAMAAHGVALQEGAVDWFAVSRRVDAEGVEFAASHEVHPLLAQLRLQSRIIDLYTDGRSGSGEMIRFSQPQWPEVGAACYSDAVLQAGGYTLSRW